MLAVHSDHIHHMYIYITHLNSDVGLPRLWNCKKTISVIYKKNLKDT